MKIEFYSKDIKRYIYFISSLAQEKMYGGLSSKSDLIGGIFDRWINIIPEEIIFNKYFLPKISKKYKYINDFFRYDPVNTGIAPDLIGVKVGKKVIPFAIFNNDGWQQYNNAPQIELKTFKENQYLVSLRNQGYQGKYLVLLEMNLDSDYLLPFFSKFAINKHVYRSLKMSKDVFIEKGTTRIIEQTPKITKKSKLGILNLIRVTTANEFMNKCNLCKSGISPLYIKNIREIRPRKNMGINLLLEKYCKKTNDLFDFNRKWYKLLPHKNVMALSWDIEQITSIIINKISKSSITISIKDNNCKINSYPLIKDRSYIISYQILDRSTSSGDEFFMHKELISFAEDFEVEMIESIKEHIEKSLNQ
jgi:hypothetical protein